ncbi:MAG: DinB-like domain protein, partial [Gemmatimonadetes bacterium]|nr:DinB-like domain protein [Gemmatimonadota bacterium]
VHAKIMALANAIPEDKYSWRPSPGVRSVSEVLMHVATEYYFYVPGSVGAKPPADFGPPRETIPKKEKITAKSEVLAELNKSWAYARTQVTSVDASTLTGVYKPWGASLPKAAFGMAGDLHEHLGQLISYARSVGVKPPWSK